MPKVVESSILRGIVSVLIKTAIFRRPLLKVVALTNLSLLLLLSVSASAQDSIIENIRPVGQVCLTGQPCVGTTGYTNTTQGVSRSTPAAAVVSTPVSEPAAVEVVAEPEPAATEFDVAATYQMSCFACHGTGAAGAPVLGDQDAWTERMEKGIDSVMANVMSGLNAMPAKGLCMTCNDDDLRSLVDYMASQ